MTEWADLLPVTRGEQRRELRALWEHIIAQTTADTVAHNNLEDRMTSIEDAQYDRAREIVALLRAEFASLRSQIDAAVTDKDAAVAAGVASALADDAVADTQRITGLVDELASVLPGDVPEVPVPAPGEPAELPTGGESGGGDEPA